MNACLDAALRYLGLGLSVIPVKPRGKMPLVPWKEFQQRVPTEAEIREWWERCPEANLGVVAGSVSGVIVVDIDGPKGQETLRTLAPIPPTWRSRTGKGEHLWFKHPGGSTIYNFARRRPGLDLRGDGGFVVAPPSRHASGAFYEWVLAPGDVDLADPPLWLLELLRADDDGGPQRRRQRSEDEWLQLLQGAPEGQRHTTATRIAGHFLARGYPPSIVETLLRAYAIQCQPPFDLDDVRRIVEDLVAKDPHKRTEGGPYRVENGCLCREKATGHGPIVEPLCNFTAAVTEEVVLDDGIESTRAFVIEGTLDSGVRLPAVRVPAARFAGMTWVTESWGLRAVVRAGQTTRDYLREAIQRLSPAARERRVFTHTGWREIAGQWLYLTAAGGLGHDSIEVDLGQELARYRLPVKPEDAARAMRASLATFRLAPLRLTVLPWAAVYRAPLAAALPVDHTVWLEGPTGSLKSTLAALYLCHYGAFDRLHLPGTWSSTANQLEHRAFVLKDAVFVIDDYAPRALDAREVETKAARLIRSQGNLAGRGRLRADLSERPAFPPRGLILSTGEQHPPGQSLLARLLVVEVDRAAVDLAALTQAQQEAARLPHALAGYVAWLAPQMPGLPALLRETFEGAKGRAAGAGEHLRVPEGLAHLWLGLHCALNYAEEIGACSRAEADELRDAGWSALLEVGHAQGRLVEEERPTRRFLYVLLTLVTQRRVVLLPANEEKPDTASEFLGWFDEEHLFLLPEAAFKAVSRFCQEAGEPFPVREDRLRADLAKEGISVCAGGRYTATVTVGGRKRRVLQLRLEAAENVVGQEFHIPQHETAETVGTGRTGSWWER